MGFVPRIPPSRILDPYMAALAPQLRFSEVALARELRGPYEGWREVGAVGEPNFQGAWGNADTNTAAFTKDTAGLVSLKGHVAGGNTGDPIFELPEIYWPPQIMYAVTRVVHANGEVELGGVQVGSNSAGFTRGSLKANITYDFPTLLSLNNIAFPVSF